MAMPISDETKRKFAEIFLRTGNAREAARKVGVSVGSAHNLSLECESDPEFLSRRERLLKRSLDQAEAMALELLQIANSRAKKKSVELVGEAGNLQGIHDKGPDYIRAYGDLYRSIQSHAKLKLDLDPDKKQTGPLEVVIKRATKENA